MRIQSAIQRARRWGSFYFAIGLLVGSACIYDADSRCGLDRELSGKICVCKAGMTEQAGRCVVREDRSESACDDDDDCGDEPNAVCHHVDATDVYCTRTGCNNADDCPEGHFCNTDATPSLCTRAPTGQGEQCSSSADCQGFDASFCGVGDPRGATCWVPNCTAHSCAPGYTCFDISPYIAGAPMVCAQ